MPSLAIRCEFQTDTAGVTSSMRKSWDEYFLSIAHNVAERSTCNRKQVGCVIVRDRAILSTGYAGSVRGQPHCTDVGCDIGPDGGCRRTIHRASVYGTGSCWFKSSFAYQTGIGTRALLNFGGLGVWDPTSLNRKTKSGICSRSRKGAAVCAHKLAWFESKTRHHFQ